MVTNCNVDYFLPFFFLINLMKLNYIELSLNGGLQVLLFTILLIVIYNFDFEEREKNSTQSSSISGSDLMSA